MTKITFVYHDCFFVETDNADIVFDFWRDPVVNKGDLPLFLRHRDEEKPLFVFVSHHHKDHYTKEIFSWTKFCRNIHYIISHDTFLFCRHLLSETAIYAGPRPLPSQVTVLKPGENFNFKRLTVETFGSTDIGNSYYLEVGDLRLFHAGDLNAWVWKDESTESEVNEAISKFTEIIDAISAKHQELDYAFFPVDSRIGRDYFTGASIFLEKINVRKFFPMHFCLGETKEIRDQYMRDACDFQKFNHQKRGEYIGLTYPYSSYMSIPE